MIPPAWFVRSLTALDNLLSIRWGSTANQWIIERRAVIPETELGYLKKRVARLKRNLANPPKDTPPSTLQSMERTFIGVSEELASALTGKRVILFAKTLSAKLFDALVAADITRYGGYARFADQLEAAEESREKDVERQMNNQRNALNKETYDMLNFIWRKKEDMLLNGNRDLRHILHGRKTTPDSEPLIKITDF